MIDNFFREKLEQRSQKLINLYTALGLHPNTISLLGFLGALFSGYAILLEQDLIALATWWIGRFFDGTDGILARTSGKTSPFGAYLDILLDMAAYSFIIVIFSYKHPEFQIEWTLILLLYVLCITSALAQGMQELIHKVPSQDNRGLRFGAGLAEAGETSFTYSLLILFPSKMQTILWIWLAILLTTVLCRTIVTWKTFQNENKKKNN